MRTALLVVAAAFLILAPGAAGQATYAMTITRGPPHPEDHVLDLEWDAEDGKPVPTTMPIVITMEAAGFVCPTETTYSVHIVMEYESSQFWAGASVNPEDATITIPQGKPGPDPEIYTAAGNPELELTWGEDSRDNQDVVVDYTLTTQTAIATGGPCLPPPAETEDTVVLKAKLPARAVPQNTTVPAEVCEENPSLPQCQTQETAAPEEAPGIETVVFALALTGLVLVMRRRTPRN